MLSGGRGLIRSAAATGRLLSAALLVAVLCGVLAGCGRSDAELPPRGVIAEAPPLVVPPLAPSVGAEARTQVADPVRIRIPVIGVDAPVGPLYVDDNGVLPPPDGDHVTGWWKQGPEPGEQGPAVIAG